MCNLPCLWMVGKMNVNSWCIPIMKYNNIYIMLTLEAGWDPGSHVSEPIIPPEKHNQFMRYDKVLNWFCQLLRYYSSSCHISKSHVIRGESQSEPRKRNVRMRFILLVTEQLEMGCSVWASSTVNEIM